MSSKLGRNDPCWCGSGKKYKHCHLRQDEAASAVEAQKAAPAPRVEPEPRIEPPGRLAFYLSGRAWDNATEYSLGPDARHSSQVKMGDLPLRMKQRFLCLL